MQTVLLVVLSVLVIYAVYRLIHYFVPGWGTIMTNISAGVVALLDVLQTLPWSTALPGQQTGVIMIGLALSNALMRITPSNSTIWKADQ